MKIALCQINPIVGSIDSNVDKLVDSEIKSNSRDRQSISLVV